VLGEHHSSTLIAAANLAGIYQLKGQLSDAMILQQKCYNDRKEKFGNLHPHTLTSMQMISNLLIKIGDFKQAKPLASECFQGRLATLGASHVDTIGTAINLNILLTLLATQESCDKILNEASEVCASCPSVVVWPEEFQLKFEFI